MARPLSVTDLAAKRPPVCAAAPLLEILLPLIAGILAATLGTPCNSLALLLSAISIALIGRVFPLHFPQGLRIAALLLGFISTSLQDQPPHPDWSWQPPRETTLEMRLERGFNARKESHFAGLARLEHTALRAVPQGSRLAFYLKKGELGDEHLLPGAVVRCRGVLQFLPANPHPDDYQEHLLQQDIFLSFNQGEVLELVSPPSTWQTARHALLHHHQSLLTTACRDDEDPGMVIGSMLLGNRSLLNETRMTLYRDSGTLHLFAVSGLHVGSVALCLYSLATFLRIGGRPRLAIILLATWTYIWMTGSTASGVRAGIMLTAVSSARLLLRQSHLFPALVLSACIVLLWQPAQLFHLGFQLSYAVVLGIVLIALPLSRLLQDALLLHRPPRYQPRAQRRYEKVVRTATDLSCVSLSSSLVSMPLIIEHFTLMTPGGVLAGLLLNGLVFLIVSGAVLAMLLEPLIGELLAGTMVVMLWPMVDLIEGILRLTVAIPGAVERLAWIFPGSGTATTCLCLACAWAVQRWRMSRPLPNGLLLMPLLIPAILIGFGTVHT
jgi:competence protein ComEC